MLERTAWRTILCAAMAATWANAAPRLNPDLDKDLSAAIMRRDARAAASLLSQGANPNTKTADGAPLLVIAAMQRDRKSLEQLLKAGADPNANTVTGRSALAVAASVDGSFESVRMLLDRGADIEHADQAKGMPILFQGAGATPLIESAKVRDSRVLRLLVDRGANVNGRDPQGATALNIALLNGNLDHARYLVAHRADATIGHKNGVTPLMAAAISNNPDAVKLILSSASNTAGIRDMWGNTALMWAAYSERADIANVQALLAAGSDANASNKLGETALAWAQRNGRTPIVELLEKASGKPAGVVEKPAMKSADRLALRAAVNQAMTMLQRDQDQFVKKSGCTSCHSHSIPSLATVMAAKMGYDVSQETVRRQQKAQLAMVKPMKPVLIEGNDAVPDAQISVSYLLIGLGAEQYARDEFTDAMVMAVASKQQEDGGWKTWVMRQPMEDSAVRATALALRAMQLYAPAGLESYYARRVEMAKNWLWQNPGKTTDENIQRLFGLAWGKASREQLDKAGRALLAAQRADGGWDQVSTLESDAYATGRALMALLEAGVLKPGDNAFRKGVEFLRSTQKDDGSWHVTSRSFPFQPLIDTGFPHGRDRWISQPATAWAAMALMAAGQPERIAQGGR